MTNGAMVMENDDRKWIETLFNSGLKPLQESIKEVKTDVGVLRKETQQSFKDLPCPKNTEKIIQIETRQANGREHTKEAQTAKSESRDFVIKAITIVLSVLALGATVFGALYATGFFKALAK